ncbi:DUF177 domain-containing protein [Jannaschia sp. M317]|uniref:YceD family protein n=1 Tax=Jannaschia sp. M317 TaxID=2867011 RepID=UPI0021A8C5B2|nr:DUF177 domain-containing protein [Jannaschia sp. M317]UWQ17105.1 DUF177 domain-containing protein [Jannaschia sp. M317]
MKPVLSHPLRLADLRQRRATHVRLVPDAGQLEALADRLDVDILRKVRLEGDLTPGPGRDWTFSGHLGATVVQPCRVTTDPVTTRIEESVVRRYTPDFDVPPEEEVEMAEDENVEPLPDVLDMGDLLEESLILSIPPFPRVDGAEDVDLSAAPPGAEPLTDEAVKPFAGLAALKAKMDKGDD